MGAAVKGWKPAREGAWSYFGDRETLADAVVYPSDVAPGYDVAIVGGILRRGVVSLTDARFIAELALGLTPEALEKFRESH